MQISTYFIKRPEGWISLSSSVVSFDNVVMKSVPSEGSLLLVPFRTASFHSFSFPFRSAKDVRNALALKFRPLLSGEAEVELVPLFTGRNKGSSEGIALSIWGEEIPGDEPGLSLHNNVVWPLPLALAGAVRGEGGAVFRDDYVCASAFFRNGLPVFIRTRATAPDDGGIEAEVRCIQEYAAAVGIELSPESIWRSSQKEALFESTRETLKQFPRFLELNISRPALAASLARERTASMLLKIFGWATAAGVFLSIIQFSMLFQLRSSLESFTQEGASLYREVFGPDERIVDPLSQARGKLAELKGQGKNENSLSRMLSHLGRTWLNGDQRKEDFPVLEQLRFSSEGADITGTAEKMESIQDLRTVADGSGYRAALGDIQQIPGGGLRFTLSLRRDLQ